MQTKPSRRSKIQVPCQQPPSGHSRKPNSCLQSLAFRQSVCHCPPHQDEAWRNRPLPAEGMTVSMRFTAKLAAGGHKGSPQEIGLKGPPNKGLKPLHQPRTRLARRLLTGKRRGSWMSRSAVPTGPRAWKPPSRGVPGRGRIQCPWKQSSMTHFHLKNLRFFRVLRTCDRPVRSVRSCIHSLPTGVSSPRW